MNPSIVIIGAGPAGLTAALTLARKGLRPVIVEAHHTVGGLARTERFKGFSFDIGGHRFFTKDSKIVALWQEMLGGELLRVKRRSRIYYKGKYLKYPIEIRDALEQTGIFEGFHMLASYLRSQIRPHNTVTTLEEWMENQFGRYLYRLFFKTYSEKVWGLPCHRISADWAAQRIKGLSLKAALANTVFRSGDARSLVGEFMYPQKGAGMMWERFQHEIESRGGFFRFNHAVDRIVCRNGRVRSISGMAPDGPFTIPVTHLLSSIALPALVSTIAPPPDDLVQSSACRLKLRAFILVVLILNRKEVFPDQWIYVHSPDLKVGRIQNFKNWSAAMVPDPEKTSVGMEYFCTAGDDFWNMPDSELVELAEGELCVIGLAHKSEFEAHFIVRQPDAYPVYDTQYRKRIAVLRKYLSGIPNLQTLGRNGLFRYNNMDHSMQTGILAAENIKDPQSDLWTMEEEGSLEAYR